jgi:hypothetical protein
MSVLAQVSSINISFAGVKHALLSLDPNNLELICRTSCCRSFLAAEH